MPERLFDRFPFFWWARLDIAATTGPARPPQRRHAVNLLDMSDPPRFWDEAVVTLHELLNLDVRGHTMPSDRLAAGAFVKSSGSYVNSNCAGR